MLSLQNWFHANVQLAVYDFCAQAYKDLVMELDVLTMVGKHQNLVEFYGACVQDPNNPVILEELVEGPNLETFLEVSVKFSESSVEHRGFRSDECLILIQTCLRVESRVSIWGELRYTGGPTVA